MKKTAAMILSLVLLFSLSACIRTEGDDGGAFPALKTFTAETLDGGAFTAEDFAKYDLTVLNIWATYCGPCISEMPQLAAFAKTLPENVRLITLCLDVGTSAETAEKILETAGYDGVTLIRGDGDLIPLLKKIIYVPTTLFLDAEGNVVGSEIIGSPSDLTEAYASHINEALNALGKAAAV